MTKQQAQKSIETITHAEASRKHIPTAEYQALLEQEAPLQRAYSRRNRDLDPQLVWRGKDEPDWSDLTVPIPPIYIQEKIQPKVLLDDLRRQSACQSKNETPQQLDMFADFNGLPDEAAKTQFYEHEANWSNRMILGDSLQVMASLAEREGLRGQVQCIYFDPPYGIKFNSNFQWSTTSREVKDGQAAHITREPEQVKAFRDTWRDGIHSYLTYLRDRLTVARELLTESGSIFVQIGDENVHRVRALMDEVFGDENFVSQISFVTTTSTTSVYLSSTNDFVLWYARSKSSLKYRPLWREKLIGPDGLTNYKKVSSISALENYLFEKSRFATLDQLTSQSGTSFPLEFRGKTYTLPKGSWKTNAEGVRRLNVSGRIALQGKTPRFVRFSDDFGVFAYTNNWTEQLSEQYKNYVVQTSTKVIQRCILMTTDPGDLVLDPTCGSGTTAYVAEQWGRRWLTIDTSRVALALARARLMGARYPYYLLKDSREGQQKEAELSGTIPPKSATCGNIRQGFVYERVPHITLKAIANNAEIDVIWETYQEKLAPLSAALNQAVGQDWAEWEIPRQADEAWSAEAQDLHQQWWQQRIARQKEIDAAIAAKADYEYLYDKPYQDKKTVRVAGPFTVESLSPHRVMGADDELSDRGAESRAREGLGFAEMILENLKIAGAQRTYKDDKITFSWLKPWPGHYICAEGHYADTAPEADEAASAVKRAGIFIGPQFGTVTRPDLVAAAREAGEAGFEVLLACAFNYEARTTELNTLGRIPILKVRLNADLHMAAELKNTGGGNLFVIFGEPDIDLLAGEDGQFKVKLKGVDIFDPRTGEVRSDGVEGIALWFVDTDYNEESFFVRQAYFLGANDPYKALKTTLKAEVNQEAWDSLYSDTSRPFAKPASGRIAVKVINHLGDEVLKVFQVR